MKTAIFSFLLLLTVTGVLPPSILAQDIPGMENVPDMLEGQPAGGNNLANLLRMDLMQRFMQAQTQVNNNNTSGGTNRGTAAPPNSRRPSRPSTELGGGPTGTGIGSGQSSPGTMQEPVDLSKYLGPDGDPERTLQRLIDAGRIPPIGGQSQSGINAPALNAPAIPAAPVSGATGAGQKSPNLFKDVPIAKRLDYAENMLNRREFDNALGEVENILDQKLKDDELIRALTLREKALFHQGFFEAVEDDYYRLKAYYPKEKRVDALKKYLETEAGLAPLQDEVKKNPNDSQAHSRLLRQYRQFGWLDFAEQFFAEEIESTSEATVKSLSEIYQHKQDPKMLVQLSRTAQKLYPQEADFYYNEGVGLFNQGDPKSLEEARGAFQKAQASAPSAFVRQGINYYLNRLPPAPRPLSR